MRPERLRDPLVRRHQAGDYPSVDYSSDPAQEVQVGAAAVVAAVVVVAADAAAAAYAAWLQLACC